MTIFKKKATDIQETKKLPMTGRSRKASVLTAQWSLSVRWHLE